jgi:hypothetical protein
MDKQAPNQPTITSQNSAPRPPIQTVVEIPDDQIEARPLTLPGAFNIKLKNPNLSARGINFVAGRGQGLTNAKVLGYRTATQADVAVAPGWSWLDGAFRMGDLLLMVMDKRKYVGAIKYNEQTSMQLGSRGKRHKDNAREVTAAALSKVPPSVREYASERVSIFDPIEQMGEEKFEEVIGQHSEPLVPLPETLYGGAGEDNPRIINKSKAPVPGE